MRLKIANRVNRLYKVGVSPLLHLILGPNYGCRFTPTCSDYCHEAFREHGLLKALILTAWRILRCQPFAKSGFDPVPRAIETPSKQVV